ncbi:MAG: hypothetical protein FWB95_02665 [Treponema sp.]|nr:hypothetical protein [Treponema sp.]
MRKIKKKIRMDLIYKINEVIRNDNGFIKIIACMFGASLFCILLIFIFGG